MEKTNAIFAFAVAALLIFSSGCAQRNMPGSDRDSHGCIGSAGYAWCAEKNKCIRPWEENCTSSPAANQPLVGNDRDEHGCIGSAGYAWCEGLGKCIRPWETICTSPSDVRILTENFPPFNFQNREGVIDGRSSQIVRAILADLNQTAKIEAMGWPAAYQIALSEPNVALYSSERSPLREPLFKWVGPIGTFVKTLYAKEGSGISMDSVDDAMAAKSICVVRYDSREQILSGLGFANLVLADSDADCIRSLVSGNVTLWFGSEDTMPYVAVEAGVGKSEVTPVLNVDKSEIYIAFSKNTPDSTVEAWQNALDAIKRDGIFDSLMDRWGANNKPGSDIDEHGCYGDAGYYWCAPLSKCVRPWETTCPEEQLVGGDRDEHGCIGSAGYQWCPELSKCVQVWETPCPSLTKQALEAQAKTYCGSGNTIYTCGEYIKVVGGMPGAGSKFYKLGDYGEPISCPVISPEYMTPACRQLLLGNNCVEQKVDCGPAPVQSG